MRVHVTRLHNHYRTGDAPRMAGYPAVRYLRNLAWVLRNAGRVSVLSLVREDEGARFTADGVHPNGLAFTFVAHFACYRIAQDFMARRRFSRAAHVL
jgi:hypothetical protein